MHRLGGLTKTTHLARGKLASRCMALSVTLAFVLPFMSIGCGRTMSQSDCEKVGNHMRDVWDSDVKANAPSVPEGAPQDLAQLVIKNHRERIGSEWMNQCRRELEGRHVDEKELDCILKSKTIADVQGCATRSGE